MFQNHARTALAVLVGAFVLGVFLLRGQATRQTEAQSTPRFQLYEAEWDVIPQKGATYKAKSLFRIDTQTGMTTYLAATAGEKGYSEGWVLIEDFPKRSR